MRASHRFCAFLLVATCIGGCRYKGWESFTSATEVNPPLGVPVHPGRAVNGDAYAFGGIGEANGGLNPQTNYGVGSNPNSPAPVNDQFDRPEMGSAQQPGYYPNRAVAGSGQENAPALQPSPSDLARGPEVAHG